MKMIEIAISINSWTFWVIIAIIIVLLIAEVILTGQKICLFRLKERNRKLQDEIDKIERGNHEHIK